MVTFFLGLRFGNTLPKRYYVSICLPAGQVGFRFFSACILLPVVFNRKSLPAVGRRGGAKSVFIVVHGVFFLLQIYVKTVTIILQMSCNQALYLYTTIIKPTYETYTLNSLHAIFFIYIHSTCLLYTSRCV